MQNLRYSFLVVGALFLQVLDVVSMQPAVQMETKIPSLKKLCIHRLSKMIDNDSIGKFTAPQTIEKYFLIPDELSKEVTTNNFCHKFGHSFDYKSSSHEVNGKRFSYDAMLDELNNQVMVIEECNIIESKYSNGGYTLKNTDENILRTFAVNGQEICSFTWPSSYDHKHSGSLLCNMDYNKVTIFKNGRECIGSYECPIQYFSLIRALRNQKELYVKNAQMNSPHRNKISLFNYQTQLMVYENVDDIQFNISETICMVKDGNMVTINEMIDGARQPKMVIANVQKAIISPDGELICVFPQDENLPVQLISVKDGKVFFSFKNIEEKQRVSSVNFSCDGRYVIAQESLNPGFRLHVLDRESEALCLALTLRDMNTISIIQKYIVLRQGGKAWFIPTKNLHTMRDSKTAFFPDYKLEDLMSLGLAKMFKGFQNFHPSGDFVVICDKENREKLVDIKSGKIVTTFNSPESHVFSEPTGKMLCIKDSQGGGHEIFSLRNDFTIAEYLLTRFMSEKNISDEQLSHYPHMQKIYDSMPMDKRLFSCSRNGITKTVFLQKQ